MLRPSRHYEQFERDLTKVARPPYVSKVQAAFSGREKAARSTWGHEQALQQPALQRSNGGGSGVHVPASPQLPLAGTSGWAQSPMPGMPPVRNSII